MDVPIRVDLEAGIPIYLQIVEQVKEKIFSGELRPGQQLPTVRQLAAELRVNFNTVARAYAILDQEGIISTQRGRGTYIRERLGKEDVCKMRVERLRLMVADFVAQLRRLGYSAEEVYAAVHQELEAEEG